MQKQIFKAIGLMSGTSLDGLDIAYCTFQFVDNTWKWKIEIAETKSFPEKLKKDLADAMELSGSDLTLLSNELGDWMGQKVKLFIKTHDLAVDVIGSHGHTIFHQPEKKMTLQIGNPHAIHALTQTTVIADFRALDVAKGGQGAPLVPIGDLLLFPQYEVCLNLGGIANISIKENKQLLTAYDITVCNILLNTLAAKLGKSYDENGAMAAEGKIIPSLLAELNSFSFLATKLPKSLGRESIDKEILPLVENSEYAIKDMLATAVEHISLQTAHAIQSNLSTANVLITGGGAFNTFLIRQLQEKLTSKIKLATADKTLIAYKEALIFAFLAVLNSREEVNVLGHLTGAQSDSIAGIKIG